MQGFYDWYVSHTTVQEDRERKEPSAMLALQEKHGMFSTALLNALKQDLVAQAKSGELVGLDFDPFLNSQDPDERYDVRKATHQGNACRAEVYGAGHGAPGSGPDVLAEAVELQGKWRFVNFLYPRDKTDLLGELKALENDRRTG